MIKKLLYAVTGVVFFLAPASQDALAQTDTPKAEDRTATEILGNPITLNSFTSHNLQLGIGVGVRF